MSAAVVSAPPRPPRPPTKQEMDAVFALCRSNHWSSTLQCLKSNPQIGITTMTMDNHIATTVCHQAITSKGDVQARASVILQILSATPQAATIKNGYGSLCLHCACQRNVKIDAKTKELVILKLIEAHPGGLVEEGGVGRRTPLHIIFTDYISPKLTRVMIERGKAATFMKDKKGYLPIHVAVSRHVSPDKLSMLLAANPGSLFEVTNQRKNALQLAKETATRSHPNFALINALQSQAAQAGAQPAVASSSDIATMVPARVSSNDSAESPSASPPKNKKRKAKSKRATTTKKKRSSKTKVKQEATTTETFGTQPTAAADLLLNFARSNINPASVSQPEEINSHATQVTQVAEV